MKSFWIILVICITIAVAFTKPSHTPGVLHTIEFYQKEALLFGESASNLKKAVFNLDPNDTLSLQQAKQALVICRAKYKRIEFFLEHFIPVTARPFNLAPVHEVEEPYMEYQQPRGMQLMEAILFDENLFEQLDNLKENAELVNTYANDLNAMVYGLEITDAQVIESARMEVLRVITLGITGFDAPELKTGITEAVEAIKAVKHILQPYIKQVPFAQQQQVQTCINHCIFLLETDAGFDSFNRIHFLTEAALPLQQQLNLLALQLFPNAFNDSPLSVSASNIFSKNALAAFNTEEKASPSLIALGEKLFFEKRLSGNGKRSCATCHDPGNYFTDGLKQSIAFNETSFVKRNAPTLLYASMQHGLFWDARAKSTNEQAHSVLMNADEMNGNEMTITKRLKKDKTYRKLFTEAFPSVNKDSLITITHITKSISAFEKKLAPYSSAFDDYMRGNTAALTRQQIDGYNIFSGKAQCGTCHFAPLFNGLLPPEYAITELEVLGTPANTNFDSPQYDNDSGRFNFFAIEYNNGAFKTPTLRNIGMTAPYMHNGSFTTLQQVMDFYNKGGGEGIGLTIQHQTLSAKPLNLTQQEIQAVISFLHSLTDSAFSVNGAKINPPY